MCRHGRRGSDPTATTSSLRPDWRRREPRGLTRAAARTVTLQARHSGSPTGRASVRAFACAPATPAALCGAAPVHWFLAPKPHSRTAPPPNPSRNSISYPFFLYAVWRCADLRAPLVKGQHHSGHLGRTYEHHHELQRRMKARGTATGCNRQIRWQGRNRSDGGDRPSRRQPGDGANSGNGGDIQLPFCQCANRTDPVGGRSIAVQLRVKLFTGCHHSEQQQERAH